jgi:hypothetical protein
MINLKNCTYGMELEYGDIWRDRQLPAGLSWNAKDYSVVSSTGIANDPKGLVYSRGGEINSDPTTTIDEQVDFFEGLLTANLEPRLNHRTNLHLHIRVPGLAQDLGALKLLLDYINRNQVDIYREIEPIPIPARGDYDTAEAYKGASKRYSRRKVSHQYKVSESRVEKALAATTVDEFLAAHAPVMANGEPAWGLTTRAGINLLQLKETDTVEFRHFTNTLDPAKLRCCFEWVAAFIPAALDDASVEQLTTASGRNFPEFAPYNHAMEVGYGFTNFDKNSRKVVTERVGELRKLVDIDCCSAEETVAAINQIQPGFAPEFPLQPSGEVPSRLQNEGQVLATV